MCIKLKYAYFTFAYFGIFVSRTVQVLQTARFIIATLISLAGIPVSLSRFPM